jgi:membrane fusion protein (multidrug efflux system)
MMDRMALEHKSEQFDTAAATNSEHFGDVAVPVIDVQPDTPDGRRQRMRVPLLILGVAVAILVAGFVYLHGGRYESTDNAYFQTGLVSVSANVSGPVIAVEVHDNERVHVGQVLFRIDPAPFETEVAQAQAALAQTHTQIEALRANYGQGQAELKAAQSQLAYATKEAERQKALLAEGISSRAQYDQAVLAQQTAGQGIQADARKNAGIAATLSGGVTVPTDQEPAVKAAQARLDRARLELGYTVVRAAQDGIVTKVNQLQVGDYVTAAHPVFTLAGTHIWVEANFKEDQLNHMRVGQPATFSVDAFPGLHLTGHLRSFSPGTGNSFALLPAENATGNWVKVVQRLPVEFEIDNPPADAPLHAGLSVTATVDTGYRRHLFGAGPAK